VSQGAPTHQKALGVLLVVVGGLIVLVKFVPAVTVNALLRLWPAVLIWLGWRMARREPSEGPPPSS